MLYSWQWPHKGLKNISKKNSTTQKDHVLALEKENLPRKTNQFGTLILSDAIVVPQAELPQATALARA